MTGHVDVVVIGGGQAGLACSYWLSRAGVEHVVVDEQEEPGGAWRRTWPSLRLFSPASYSSLPGRMMPPHPDVFPPVSHVLDYLEDYEQRYRVPVRRPVRVLDVRADHDALTVVTDGADLRTRHVVNATGTWRAPFVPHVEGADIFAGTQRHSAHYGGPDPFVGRRVAVVGGGNSAVQITADLVGSAAVVHLCSLTRLRWLPDDVDGRYLFDRATARVRGDAEGQEAELSGTIVAMPAVRKARAVGALRLRAMFDRMDATGAVIGREHVDLDDVIWATGFRPALRHLRSLRLRTTDGIPAVVGNRSAKDPRVSFIGYGDWTGPASATLIGVGRTAKALVDELAEEFRA